MYHKSRRRASKKQQSQRSTIAPSSSSVLARRLAVNIVRHHLFARLLAPSITKNHLFAARLKSLLLSRLSFGPQPSTSMFHISPRRSPLSYWRQSVRGRLCPRRCAVKHNFVPLVRPITRHSSLSFSFHKINGLRLPYSQQLVSWSNVVALWHGGAHSC